MRADIILAFASLAAAAAINTRDDYPTPEDEISEPGLGWEGVVVPGQAPVLVWGHSFEDIEAQIRKDHPDFSIYTDKVQEDPEDAVTEDPKAIVRRALETRADWGDWKCDGKPNSPMGAVEKAINRLKSINGGKCYTKARTCTRFVCESTNGIGLCNRNTHQVNIACSHLARMANHITKKCIRFEQWCSITPNGCGITATYTGGTAYSEGGSWRMKMSGCSWFGSGGSRAWVG